MSRRKILLQKADPYEIGKVHQKAITPGKDDSLNIVSTAKIPIALRRVERHLLPPVACAINKVDDIRPKAAE